MQGQETCGTQIGGSYRGADSHSPSVCLHQLRQYLRVDELMGMEFVNQTSLPTSCVVLWSSYHPLDLPVSWAAWTEQLRNPHRVLERWGLLHLVLGCRAPNGQASRGFGGFLLLPVSLWYHLLMWAGLALWLTCVILGGIRLISVPSSEYSSGGWTQTPQETLPCSVWTFILIFWMAFS